MENRAWVSLAGERRLRIWHLACDGDSGWGVVIGGSRNAIDMAPGAQQRRKLLTQLRNLGPQPMKSPGNLGVFPSSHCRFPEPLPLPDTPVRSSAERPPLPGEGVGEGMVLSSLGIEP